ncbi:hypothetical protein RHSIM_Rhsim01G0081500 [Rhododendron simsii]|uniref:Uncharacterized protein n=1 Tax=Rhododendron simsii TaxID=118357 RepID=A0A834HEM0_RHOSS|nr:hypothetical protein RHSIM_Rhsim01G0081500 [Rhododendron simsii]
MLCNPHRVPLTYLDWNSVPEEIKSAIWKEIEDNIEDCPAEFQPVAMRSYQWKELVSYWRTMDAKLIETRNSKNREWRGPDHRTGRTHFSQIRHEMSANGENTDKMSVFIKTRDENDPDVKAVVEEFNQNLAEIPESLQTIEFTGPVLLVSHILLFFQSNEITTDGHEKVCLVSYTIPKHDVAEGIVVSKDPLVKVDGKPLGSDFWKVLVKKAKIPNASLEGPRKKFCTIGEAVDCAVAWRSCDVFVEE